MSRKNRRPIAVTATLLAVLGGSIDRARAEEVLPSSVYVAVTEALRKTQRVRLSTDLSECIYEKTGKPGPSIRTGIDINAYIDVPGRGLYFSDVHQTLDEADQPITEYVRYRLTSDGQLKVYLNRVSGSAIVKQETIVCPVPGGARFVW